MINDLIDKVTDKINFKNSGQTVSYINIYNYIILRKHKELSRAINYYTLDGIMLVLFIRLFKGKKIERKSPDFSSYFKELFLFLNAKKKKVYFLGGSKSEIEYFVFKIKAIYPDIAIAGSHEGFNFDEKEVINSIISKEVEFVIVGMGTPRQEIFIKKIKRNGYTGACFACGAFIS